MGAYTHMRLPYEDQSDRIRWDEDEKDALVATVAQMRRTHVEESLLTLFKKAVNQMPRDRQRVINALQAVPWLLPAVERKLRETQGDTTELQGKLDSISDELSIVQEQNDAMLQELSVLRHKHSVEEASVGELFAALMAKVGNDYGSVVNKITNAVDGLSEALRHLPQAAATHGTVTPVAKAVPRFKRLILVGLKRDQFLEVQRQIQNFNFVHVEVEGKSAKSMKTMPSGDAVFVLTKFVGHPTINGIKIKYGENAKFVSGGVTDLINVINRYKESLPKEV